MKYAKGVLQTLILPLFKFAPFQSHVVRLVHEIEDDAGGGSAELSGWANNNVGNLCSILRATGT